MSKIESIINDMENSETSEDAFKQLCDSMHSYGYERIVFSLMTDHPALNLQSKHGLATNYPGTG